MQIGFKKIKETDSSSAENNSKQVTGSQKRLKNFEVTDSDREDYHNLVDILFVIDTTSSMGWCFEEAKNTVKDIAEMFNKQEFDIKYALCQYRDHPPQDSTFVYKHYDLQSSTSIQEVLGQLYAQGGGDGPEAVMDGLYEGINKTKWRKDHDGTNSKRFLFHICDAPPHGVQYGGNSSNQNWGKNGCPCGITAEKIKKQLDDNKITYNLIMCGDECNLMEKIFRQVFGKIFEETIPITRSQIAQQMQPSNVIYPPPSYGFHSLGAPPPINFASNMAHQSYMPMAANSFNSMPPSSAFFGGSVSLAPQQVQQQQQNLYSQQIQQNLFRNLM